jgi:hypothetical protein
MKEKLIKKIIETVFVIRYWIVIIMLIVLIAFTYKIYYLKDSTIRDTVAVFAGGAVLITIFYHILNYEYSQRKFKHEIKSSRDILSFNTAMDWQKEFLTKSCDLSIDFYEKNKELLQDGLYRKFHEEINKEENNQYHSALLTVLNFFESISLGVKQEIMDETFIKGFFQSLFVGQLNKYRGYINYRRELKQNPKILCNFTELSEKWLSCM